MDRNIEEDMRAYDELMALGIMTVPVTVIDGRPVKGFDERGLREALASRAAPPPDR